MRGAAAAADAVGGSAGWLAGWSAGGLAPCAIGKDRHSTHPDARGAAAGQEGVGKREGSRGEGMQKPLTQVCCGWQHTSASLRLTC